MAIELTNVEPWKEDDAERMAKFSKGEIGKTSDIWTAKPSIAPCWRGDYREWHIEDGSSYQSQLYCKFWDMFINPSGRSCEICKSHLIKNWASSQLRIALADAIAAKGKDFVGEQIGYAFEKDQLTEQQALELVNEFKLDG